MKQAFFKPEKVTDHITAIWTGCGEVLYFIEGKTRGLLMDTSLGVGHLKELVDSLTDKPYDVVLTHGHVDHSLGAPEFGTVYLNHKDIPIFQAMSPMEERLGYLHAGLQDTYDAYGFEEKDFVPPAPDMKFLDLKEGDSFDLGGLHVDLYAFPGHTPGSMVLLAREERILILGDACNDSTFLFDENSGTVEAYRKETERIRDLLEVKYDRVFICHHAIDTGADILENMIDVCDAILAGKADDIPFQFRNYNAYIAKSCSPQFVREDGKSGNLIYSKEKIWEGERK